MATIEQEQQQRQSLQELLVRLNQIQPESLVRAEDLRDGTDDKQTKDEVLVQATKSIFAPQSSGYLKGEPETPQGSQIIEIVRGLTGTKD